MGIKKVNAVLGLCLSMTCLWHIATIVYIALSNTTPGILAKLPMHICMGLVLLHILISFGMIFFLHEGKSLRMYPRANVATVLQRGSGILMAILLFFHLKLYEIFSSGNERGTAFFILVILVMILFFGTVFLHISVSFTRGLITLGIITSMDTKRKIDRVVWVIMGILFLASSTAMTYGYYQLYHMGG